MIKKSDIPVIDLFAGVGGLGLGAMAAGADLRLSVENDSVCCQTLRANKKHHKGKILERDVASLSGMELRREAEVTRSDPLLIVGGAPCQPFSKAAYWTDPGHDSRYREAKRKGQKVEAPNPITVPRADARRTLIEEYWRLVVEAKADAFVFENVPSILHPRNIGTFRSFRKAFEDCGYLTTLCKVNAAEYGVPQTRERVFLLGMKGVLPEYPEKTHCLPGESLGGCRSVVTAGKALATFSSDKFFEPEEVVEGKWAEQLFEVPPGWNYKALTAWAGHPKPIFEAEKRFWNFLLKLSPDRPSWTIAANPGPWTGPFHWDNRRLRTVELAALQSFPRGYKFLGNRRERVRQIGNAVPPLLAKKMSEMILKHISGEIVAQKRNIKVAAVG